MASSGELTIGGKVGNINKDELMKLAVMRKPNGNKMTHEEIANELGVSRGAVTKALAKIPKSMLIRNDIDNFRKARAEIFADIQKLILTYITPAKLKGSSLQQLGNLFKIFYEKEKLELGQATEHIAVIHKNNLDKATVAMIQKAIEEATDKQMAEARETSRQLAQGNRTSLTVV
jgi:predicted transcriptional regulator